MGTLKSMANCFTRLLACWKPNRHLQSQYSSIQQQAETHDQKIDWTKAVARGLGDACMICGEGTSNHVAITDSGCLHSACAECWASWGEDRCMLCSSAISKDGGIVLAPADVVKPAEPSLKTLKAEQALEASLASLVSLKQELTQMKTGLKATLEHASEQNQGDEARAAALRVEAVDVLFPVMRRLLELLDPDADVTTTGWTSSRKRLEQLSHELCTLHHTALVRKARERCRRALQHKGEADRVEVGLAWRGQSAVIEKLRVEVAVLMPQALEAVMSVLAEREMLQAVTALSGADMLFAVAVSGLEDALAKLDAAATRLLDMPSPRSASFEQVSSMTPKSRAVFDDMLMDERQHTFEAETVAAARSGVC